MKYFLLLFIIKTLTESSDIFSATVSEISIPAT